MTTAPAAGLCVFLLALCASTTARALPSSCGQIARDWAARCSARHAISLEPADCLRARATFEAHAGDARLRVEVAGDAEHRVSPVGEFPDWNRVPAPTRALLADVQECAREGVDAHVFDHFEPGRANLAPPDSLPSPGWPWRLIAGAALGLATLALGVRVHRRRLAPVAALAVLAVVATFVVRRVLFPPAFFHQNSQGVLWINYALGAPCSYGPGYFQILGRVARGAPLHPDAAVFDAIAALSALGPLFVYAIVRTTVARAPLAAALAVAVAVDPCLVRLANGESYFALCLVLLLGAGAVLACGAQRGTPRSAAFVLGVIASGLFVSQAALVHPVCWVPAATVPLIVLTGPGPFRKRIALGLVSAVAIGAIVVASAAPALLHVGVGEGRWAESASAAAGGRFNELWRIAALAAISWLLVRRGRHRARRLPVFVAVVAGLWATASLLDILAGQRWIHDAWRALFLPAAVATVAALVTRVARTRRATSAAAGVIVLLAAISCSTRWHETMRLPTDALEARFAMSWRDRLPSHARLAYLARARRRLGALPLYQADPRGLELVELSDDDDVPRALDKIRPDVAGTWYYRSSACSSPEARRYCDELEKRLVLEQVTAAELPALESLPGLEYDTPRVTVALYRLLGTH